MDGPWIAHYPKGVPTEIDADTYPSIAALIDACVEEFGPRPAFSCMGTTLTFGDVESRSRAFGAYLQKELGLERGERIAIMLPNLLQYPIAMFGALRAGLTVVNVNPLYTPRELEHQLTDSGATAIVVLANFAHVLEQVIDRTRVRHVVVTELGDQLKGAKRVIVNVVVKRVKKMVPAYRLPGALRFNDVLARGARASLDAPPLDGDDIAFLQYTGGTTGRAKGAVLTHRNIVANTVQMNVWIAPRAVRGEEIVITPLPLYHIFALTVNCFSFMMAGGLNVLIPNPRDLEAFIAEMSRFRFTAISGVNTLFNALNNDPSFPQKVDFSGLRFVAGGGMAVQDSVAERWQSITGVVVLQGYGLTEASPVVSVSPVDVTGFDGSVGMPVPSTEVSVRGDDGEPLPAGEAGELWVRGPQVMRGYWERPEETAETITEDGWLKTGDVATLDDTGSIRIVDRKKDVVIVSGFKVYPNEVEGVMAMMDEVLEAACIGVPDDTTGEAVKVLVVPQPGTELTVDAIRTHCREQMTAYKVPKHVEFREELPKTNVGKILRRELRE